MRYLYVIALILFAGMYTYTSSNTIASGDDDRHGRSRDDDDDDDRGGGGGAKGNNYFEVSLNTTLNFMVNQPSHFENKQTLINAFRLKFKTKKSNCSVYARVSSYNTPRGANKNTIPLQLDHRNNNSKKVYNLTRNIHLTNYDQRLFVQKKDNKTLNFNYDLTLLPLGYDYPEGQYNFTILFTMTQP